MPILTVVLIVVLLLVAVVVVGGYAVARRRASEPGWEDRIRAADRAPEDARALDRGWDRSVIDAVARKALVEQRPGFEPATLDLVLVDDRPGVEEDRAHVMASGPGDTVRIVLARHASGAWNVERLD